MADAETWTPCCSIEEADRILTRTGSLLEIETRIIDGRVLKVWKNLWSSLRLFFLHSTKKYADKTYIVYEKERYTFREILDKSVKCAAIFRNIYGIKKGDQACHLLGIVTALVNISQPLELLRYCIMLTRCALIVLDPERADMIELITAELSLASGAPGCLVLEDHEGKGHWEGMDVWSTVSSGYGRDPGDVLSDDPQILPEDNASITFTSGTTGLPSSQVSLDQLHSLLISLLVQEGVLNSQRAFLTPVFNVTTFPLIQGLSPEKSHFESHLCRSWFGLMLMIIFAAANEHGHELHCL